MDFDLKLAADRTYAVLTNYYHVTHASAIERQRAMQAFATAHGISRFLIDTREKRFVGGALGLYTFARVTLPKEGFDRTWKVALVTSPDDKSHDFLETVSQNAGYQVMVFKDYEHAIAWLGEGKSGISKR